MSLDDLDETERKSLGRRINDERNRRGLTITQLAAKAGCAEKSVRNIIEGKPARGKTLSEVCTALQLAPGNVQQTPISDHDHGSYNKSNYEEYEGYYFAFRRSFSFPRNILRSVFSIAWHESDRCLRFEEFQRYDSAELDSTIDHSQGGEIFISNTVGLLHFMTKAKVPFVSSPFQSFV
jgi:transcriptional regulator with XRE-family HTH domain